MIACKISAKSVRYRGRDFLIMSEFYRVRLLSDALIPTKIKSRRSSCFSSDIIKVKLFEHSEKAIVHCFADYMTSFSLLREMNSNCV